MAVVVPDGTVSSVALFNPTINVTADPGTYTASNGNTFEISGTGGFSGIASTLGRLNGTLQFSNTVGGSLAQALADFFVFSDARGGTYNFSLASVDTVSLNRQADTLTSGTLYLLGTIVDANLNYTTPTSSSITLQFNSNGPSAYSSALTLSVPATTAAVPEPASWAMMLGGFGLVGGALRSSRRQKTTVTFA